MERSFTQNTPSTQKDSSPSIASVSSTSSSQTSKSAESKDSFISSESVPFSVDVPSPAPSESTAPMVPDVDTNQTKTEERRSSSSSVSSLEQSKTVEEKIKIDKMSVHEKITDKVSIHEKITDKVSVHEKITEKMSAQEKITEELTADIDNALAEVVSGLQMLEMQQLSDKRMSGSSAKPKPSPKHTPDLVLDLPERSNSSPTGDGSEPDSPTSTADTFAKSNQGTLKKANSMPRTLPSDRFYGHPGSGQDVLLETSFMSQQPMLSTFHVKSQQTRTKTVTDSPRPSFDPMSSSVTSISSSAVAVPPVEPPASLSQSALGSHSVNPPPVAEKPKLPPKVKPPVMKKPSPPDHPRKFSLPSSIGQNQDEQKPM